MQVLMVCSGNICRSAMAELLLRAKLSRLGIDDVAVDSAGTLDIPSRPIDETCAALIRRDGIDAADYRSTPLTKDHTEASDLILCFEEKHLSKIAAVDSGAAHKTMLITDVANACDTAVEHASEYPALFALPPAKRLTELLAMMHLLRPRMPRAEEIVDPFRQEPVVYVEAYIEIKQCLSKMGSMMTWLQ